MFLKWIIYHFEQRTSSLKTFKYLDRISKCRTKISSHGEKTEVSGTALGWQGAFIWTHGSMFHEHLRRTWVYGQKRGSQRYQPIQFPHSLFSQVHLGTPDSDDDYIVAIFNTSSQIPYLICESIRKSNSDCNEALINLNQITPSPAGIHNKNIYARLPLQTQIMVDD